MTSPNATDTILTRTEAGVACYTDAARLAAEGDLPAAAVVARYSAEAYADVADAVASVDGPNSLRARMYAAACERSADLATTMAEVAVLAGVDDQGEAAASAEFAARAMRRARIAVDPRLDDNDVSDSGLARAANIAEGFAVVSQAADTAEEHADTAQEYADECARTVVAVDAETAANQARAAAHESARSAALAIGLAPDEYRDGASAAPSEATRAVNAAITADQAAAAAERHAEQKAVDENVAALRARIASPAGHQAE